MKINEYIKRKRIANGLTMKDVAKHVGVSEGTVSRWEAGEISNMRRDRIDKLAFILGIDPVTLISGPSDSLKTQSKGIRIPVYGRVAAGIPIEAIEDIEDWEEISEDLARNGEYIALRIKGDSMEPRIADGDVIIVRIQPDCENGDIVVAMINGDDATCKKIKKSPSGIMLISTNPKYDPMPFTNEEIETIPVRILGKVVELRAKF